MSLLLTALVVGAIAKAGAGILGRANQRQEARSEASYQIKQNNLDIQGVQQNRDTALGTMERELAASKETDLNNATAIQRGASQQFTLEMQDSYLSQLAAESKHSDLMASTTQQMGQLSATMGGSGARRDLTLGRVMAAEQGRQIAESRKTIDASRDRSIASGQMNIAEAALRANEVRQKYDEGSAFMELYNFKRAGITQTANQDLAKLTAKDSYLQNIIKDNTYNGAWFLADLFGVAGDAAGAATAYAGSGGGSAGRSRRTKMLDNYDH